MVDVKTLFKIIGEERAAVQRVEEAMEWLLSPKAEGIGQELLHNAHATHGIPLTIVATTTEQTGHYPLLGHVLKINPRHIAHISIEAADGTSHAISVERALAHELEHTARPAKEAADADMALLGIRLKAEAAAMPKMSEAELMEAIKPLMKASEATDYHTARAHIANYVDGAVMPLQGTVERHLYNDPDFKHYVDRFEVPAIEVENRVAALRGEPLRKDYTTSYKPSPEIVREMTIDQLGAIIEIDKKPRLDVARADGKLWTDSLGSRSGRRLGE